MSSIQGKKPNFLVMIVDDMGFSDVGCFGGEINTPNLDKLAGEGLRFLNFHTAAACSPTRSMLLSGTDNHLTGLGAMAEHQHDEFGQRWVGKPGHEGYLNDRVAALSEVLQDEGYHTILSGKWHLGLDPSQTPHARGFDESFSMLSGCHNHYGWEPQFQGGDDPKGDELTFKHFVPAIYNKNNMYNKNGTPAEVQANYPETSDGFYSTTSFTTHLLSSLSHRRADPQLSEKPFFAYLAYTAPHWPLQAPRPIREKYKGMYKYGPRALKEARLKRMKEMGIVEKETEAHEMINPLKLKEWDEMSDEEREKSATAMETYAAMVEMIDTNVGRVIDQLRQDGELDNTVVIFMSDNGAEGASYEAYPFFGDSVMSVINHFYDNSLDNIGEPNSFVWYGALWAQAATARLWKMFPTQGGIRVPFILRYPPFHSSPSSPSTSSDALKVGSTNMEFTTVMDLMPTFLDLAKIRHPTEATGGKFRGREVEPMRGKSWLSWKGLGKGEEERVHEEGKALGWELHGRAGMRIGDWKIVWIPPPYGPGHWQLYNLSSDPGETKDLSNSHPEKMQELSTAWDDYVRDTGVVWGEPRWGEEERKDEMEDPTAWMGKALR